MNLLHSTMDRTAHEDQPTMMLEPRARRVFIFFVASLLAWTAIGWACLVVLPMWLVGYMVYKLVERRLAPVDLRDINVMYLGRTTVVFGVILLSTLSAAPSYDYLASVLPLLAGFRQSGLATQPNFLVALYLIPLFTVIESRSRWHYWFVAGACACGAITYAVVHGMAFSPVSLIGLALTLILAALLMQHFYATLTLRTMKTSLNQMALIDPEPGHETEFFTNLIQVIRRYSPEPDSQPELLLHVPGQRFWLWFDSANRDFKRLPTTPALEHVYATHRAHWAEIEPRQRLERLENTKHTFVGSGVHEGVLVPVPSIVHPEGDQARLRAVIEVPVNRHLDLLSGPFWPRWKDHRSPFHSPAIRGLVMWTTGVIGFRRPSQCVAAVEAGLTQLVPAIDRILDAWRQIRARQALEECISATRDIEHLDLNKMASLVAALSGYFNCPAIIWRRDQTGQWSVGGYYGLDLISALDAEARSLLLINFQPVARLKQTEIYKLGEVEKSERSLQQLGVTHVVLAPISSQQEWYGYLGILATRQPVLKPREKQLLALAASQLGLSYSYTRQIEKLKVMAGNIVEVTTLIRELSSGGGSGATVRGIHEAVARRTRQVLDGDIVVLYALEPGQSRVVSVWTEGHLNDPIDVRELPLKVDSVVYQVARGQKPIFASDTLQRFYSGVMVHPDGKKFFPLRENVASTFAAPLVFQGETTGVLFVNYHERRTFEEHQPGDIYDLMVQIATHALAIGGYHFEWASQAVDRDRRLLRRKLHQELKGQAHIIKINLNGLIPISQDLNPDYLAWVERSILRAHAAADELFAQADQMLAVLDRQSWPELEHLGLREMLRSQATLLIGDTAPLQFESNYADGHPLRIFFEKDLLDFGVEAILNAIIYASGFPIDVSLRQDDEAVTLRISDRGPGIPDERLTQLKQSRHGFRTLRDAAYKATFDIEPRLGGGLVAWMKVNHQTYF